MPTDPLIWAVLVIAVVILGLSKGGFAGVGMASTPLVASVIDPLTAIGLMLPIMVIQDGVAVWIYRRSFSSTILLRMIPGGFLGVLAAYFFAVSVPPWGIKGVLGVVSVVFSVWQIIVHLRGVPDIPAQPRFDAALGVSTGAACGFTSAIAHAGFPPYQIYVMPKHLVKEVYVGTSVMFFASINLMKLPSYASLGLFDVQNLKTSAILIPLAIASSWLGAHLVRKVDAQRFKLIITVILLLIGVELLRQAWGAAGVAHL